MEVDVCHTQDCRVSGSVKIKTLSHILTDLVGFDIKLKSLCKLINRVNQSPFFLKEQDVNFRFFTQFIRGLRHSDSVLKKENYVVEVNIQRYLLLLTSSHNNIVSSYIILKCIVSESIFSYVPNNYFLATGTIIL